MYFQKKERNNLKARNLYNKKKEAGICVNCNELALNGRVRCKKHNDNINKYNKKTRKTKPFKRICKQCGKDCFGFRCMDCTTGKNKGKSKYFEKIENVK